MHKQLAMCARVHKHEHTILTNVNTPSVHCAGSAAAARGNAPADVHAAANPASTRAVPAPGECAANAMQNTCMCIQRENCIGKQEKSFRQSSRCRAHLRKLSVRCARAPELFLCGWRGELHLVVGV